jgi:tetratricopeptide (TPR) repeat protein
VAGNDSGKCGEKEIEVEAFSEAERGLDCNGAVLRGWGTFRSSLDDVMINASRRCDAPPPAGKGRGGGESTGVTVKGSPQQPRRASFLSDGWRMKGHCQTILKDYAGACKSFDQAFCIAQAAGDLEQEGQVHIGLGSLALVYPVGGEGGDGRAGARGGARGEGGSLADAEHHQMKALEIGKKVQSDMLVCSASGNLGKALMQQGRYKEAMEMFGKVRTLLALPVQKYKCLQLRSCQAYALSTGRNRAVQAVNLGEAHFLPLDPLSHSKGFKWLRHALEEASSGGFKDIMAAALRGLINHLTESLLRENEAPMTASASPHLSSSSSPSQTPALPASSAPLSKRDGIVREVLLPPLLLLLLLLLLSCCC